MNTFPFIFVGAIILIVVLLFILYKSRKEKKAREEEEHIELRERIQEVSKQVSQSFRQVKSFFTEGLLNEEHFFTHSEMQSFVNDNKELFENLSFLDDNNELDEVDSEIRAFYNSVRSIEVTREKHNSAFVQKELVENKDFFDNVFKYPLDVQQRESIVNLEDSCLVISSAGSGKTSTMIGKLLYLVQKRSIQPSRILTITYTRKASDELTSRLMGTGLSCMTFHKLAMTIVTKVESKKPSLAEDDLFVKIFYDQLSNPEFRRAVLNYLTDYKSMVKSEHEYINSIEYYRDRKKNGVIALYRDKNNRLISTKSEEEKKICSYLTELGVHFVYEEPYEYMTLTEDYRQYKPDFTIYYKDRNGLEQKLYLEHFAIDKNGRVPQWFGKGQVDGWNAANQQYLEGIAWKKDLHSKRGTRLIFTTSADFHDKSIREKLRQKLVDAGVIINELSTDELLEKIMERNKSVENALLQMTQSFINLVKANDKSIDDIRKLAEVSHSTRDVFVIDHLMRPIWDCYQKELQKRGEMDFTDVIVRATKYCDQGKWQQKYDYILIDEFQDISIDRCRFLKSLMSEMPHTKLFCVGDDWQSIYRFSGSDLSLFTDFSHYFGFTKECRIETTYRFGNPLIEQSSKFVQSNPMQKRKAVHAKEKGAPITKISCLGYKDNSDLQSLVERMTARVPKDKTVYIISRYSYDVKALVCPRFEMKYDHNSDTVTLKIAGRKVKFMTIHGSKGLEADYVFMLNCNSGLYGFPSLVSDDPVLDYVLSNPEHYEYAEERRVFYVGITRAKEHTVILYNINTPSPFVSEIDSSVELNQNPCPVCGVGHRIVKYEGWAKNNKPYRVWGCDNREANCQYFYREFSNGKYLNLEGKKFQN